MKKFLLILVALTVCTINLALSQIMYNKIKPYSYQSEEFLPSNQLPILEYNVSIDGNLSIDNLNVNVKEKALLEKKGDKYVSRLKFKVNARKLGEISIFFKDVKLANGTTCYVYTTDYQIVAGPITQQSINANYLTIMKLPADELILETVFNSEDDYDITLSGVNYFSAFEKKEYDTPELQSFSGCHDCVDGVVDHADNVSTFNENSCIWLGWGYPECFNMKKLKGINNNTYDISRSSCIVMFPDCDSTIRYWGHGGTLINFPYFNCNTPDECGQGLIIGCYHEYKKLVDEYDSANYEYLDRTLIRFNWHHQYGTPWHLENEQCTTSTANFNKWRQTMNFDEVIDYCGIDIFAYSVPKDAAIIKTKQKLIYKEHHLGWSSQANFDIFSDNDNDGNHNADALNPENYMLFGRRAHLPAQSFDIYQLNMTSYRNDSPYSGQFEFVVAGIGDIPPLSYSGYSSTQITLPDYDNNNQRIGIGMLEEQTSVNLLGRNYYFYFYDNSQYYFVDSCYYDASEKNMDSYYLSNFSSVIQERLNYSHTCSNCTPTTYNSSHKYMPSLENKQKCPSTQGWSDSLQVYEPCEFDINEYVDFNYVDGELCVTISDIPGSEFPNDSLPFGYRVYHNFGDQKTVAFDSYNDVSEIIFPIEFCISKCDLFYLQSLGRSNVSFSIDFFDITGRQLNNPGCDSIEFHYDFQTELCDMFTMTVDSLGSNGECCQYEITLELVPCDEQTYMFDIILANFTFKGIEESAPFMIHDADSLKIDFDMGKITFMYNLCGPSEFETALFQIQNTLNAVICESEQIELTSCSCDCPTDLIMQKWFDVTVTTATSETPCGLGNCEVDATINIPEFYDCYRSYTLNSIPGKTLLPQNGIVTNYTYSPFYCLEKGESRADTLYLYRGINDTTPCRIIKNLYCATELNPEQCQADCDSVEWDHRSLTIDLDECPDCKVFAKYKTRTNNCFIPRKQDIQIEYFTSYGYPNYTACDSCSVSTEEIQKRILLEAILKNDMDFDPMETNGSCDSTWRVVQSSCWATYIKTRGIDIISNDTITQYQITVPCDSSECCYVGLVVCRFLDSNDKVTINVDTITGGSSSVNDCELSQHYYLNGPFVGGGGGGAGSPSSGQFHFKLDSTNCINRCDWMFGISENSYSGKRAAEEYIYEMRNIRISDDVNLMMFNNNDIIHFEVFSEIPDSKEIKISLFSIQGQALINSSNILNKGKNYYQIPLYSINSGVYFVNILIDGIYYKTEKIIIIR